jgi:uncharacterized protein (TIGR02452 family)
MYSNPRKWRTDVYTDTQRRAASYPFSPSRKVAFSTTAVPPVPLHTTTEISVINADSIDAGKALKDAGYNPVVHNFASDMYAGGGVAGGSSAQEESLWRRTNLCETQFQSFYPLRPRPAEGVYTPMATVFKSKESEGCTLLPTPFQLSFIAVPAIRNPDVSASGAMFSRDAALFREKVELVFQVAAAAGHDSVVTGAFGCGAWNCPPAQVAAIFGEVLAKYNGVFKKVVFACYHVPAAGRDYGVQSVSNYEIFKAAFGV